VQKNLVGLRGYLAIWIFISHLTMVESYDAGFGSKVDWGFLFTFIRYDFIAVDIFFFLSGYLLYGHYRITFEDTSKKYIDEKFYILRLARLYPIHILTLIIIWLYEMYGIPHPVRSGLEDTIFENWEITLFLNLSLITSWGIVPVSSWNEPAWSISAIFLTYLMFPNLVLLLKKLQETKTCIILLLSLVLIQYIGYLYIEGISGTDGVGAIMRVLANFISGCITMKIADNIDLSKFKWEKIFLSSSILFVIAIYIQFHFIEYLHYSLLCIFFPFLILSLANSQRNIEKVFTNKPVLFLGSISYAIYMMHYPVLLGLKHLASDSLYVLIGDSFILPYIFMLFATIILVLIAYIVTKYVEYPIYKRIRKKIKFD